MENFAYILTLITNTGEQYAIEYGLTQTDCAYSIIELVEENPNQLSYACEAIRIVKE